MSAHTPGPWTVIDPSPNGGWYVGPGDAYIVCGRSDWDHRVTESLANAALIAAAPDLLAACKAVREFCPADPDIFPEWQRAWDLMLAAIVKAETK